MRDSRHGSFGVLAIVLSVLLRAAALAAIGDVIHGGLALIAAHAASRAPLPAVMRALPAARADGLSATAGTPGTTRKFPSSFLIWPFALPPFPLVI